MLKKDSLINISAAQMRRFNINKKEAFVKMLGGKEHLLIMISKDEGSVLSDQAISTANYQVNGDVLIVKDKLQIPINEASIELVTKDQAEISFIDQDGYMTHVKIIVRT